MAPVVLTVLAVAFGAVSPVLHRTRWSGLSQRLLWLTLVVWAILAAYQLMHRVAPSNRTADADLR
jgi:hypothetical protein